MLKKNQTRTGPRIENNISLCVKLTEGSSYGCHAAVPAASCPDTPTVSIHSTVADFAGWMSSHAVAKTGMCPYAFIQPRKLAVRFHHLEGVAGGAD